LNKSGAIYIYIYIIAIIAACIGGMSVAVLVKNAIVKKLLFIGLGVLFGIGILCAIPAISLYMHLSAMFFSIVTIVIYVCLILLASLGIWGIKNYR
jgi:peptidoglycan/LPS O-acetylase OafA/YrhL